MHTVETSGTASADGGGSATTQRSHQEHTNRGKRGDALHLTAAQTDSLSMAVLLRAPLSCVLGMLQVPVCAFHTPVVGVNGVSGVSTSSPNAC